MKNRHILLSILESPNMGFIIDCGRQGILHLEIYTSMWKNDYYFETDPNGYRLQMTFSEYDRVSIIEIMWGKEMIVIIHIRCTWSR